MKRTAGKSLRTRKAMEQAIHLIFLLCGIVAVGFVLCISVYLVISGLPAIREIGLTNFLFGKVWAPTNATTGPQFGILPFILTSVYGTAGALLLGVPAFPPEPEEFPPPQAARARTIARASIAVRIFFFITIRTSFSIIFGPGETGAHIIKPICAYA